MEKKAAHLVVRLPKAGQRLEAIIAKHEDVIALHGSVWFGVRGKALSSDRALLLREQIKQGTSTYLYVVQGSGATFAVFRAEIESISAELPNSELRHVPAYYALEKLTENAGKWILVRHFEEVQDRILNTLPLFVSGKSVVESLKRGMASLIMVRDGEIPPH